MAPPQHPETTLVQLRAIYVPEVSQAMGSIWEIMWRKVQNFRHKRCKPCWEHLFVHMNTTSVPIMHQSPQQVLLGSFSDCSCLWGEQDRCLGSRYCDQVLPKSSLSVRGRQRLCCSPNIVSGSWVSLAWCLKCPQWHRSCKMEPGLAVAAMATRLGRPPFPAAVCAWWYQAAGDQCMLQEKAGSPHWVDAWNIHELRNFVEPLNNNKAVPRQLLLDKEVSFFLDVSGNYILHVPRRGQFPHESEIIVSKPLCQRGFGYLSLTPQRAAFPHREGLAWKWLELMKS